MEFHIIKVFLRTRHALSIISGVPCEINLIYNETVLGSESGQ
jgi:hypothetical protein